MCSSDLRAVRAIAQADLVIAMTDASSDSLTDDFNDVIAQAGPEAVLVCNKTDLRNNRPDLPDHVLAISVKTGAGIDQLKQTLKQRLGVDDNRESRFTARRRHLDALRRAYESVLAGEQQLRLQQAGELLAEELKACQRSLSEITGEFSADDLLGEIFSSFCIGK